MNGAEQAACREAARLVRNYGLATDGGFTDGQGVCLMGALNQACGLPVKAFPLDDVDGSSAQLEYVRPGVSYPRMFAAVQAAVNLTIAAAEGQRAKKVSLLYWNDHLANTQTAATALEAAAEIAEVELMARHS